MHPRVTRDRYFDGAATRGMGTEEIAGLEPPNLTVEAAAPVPIGVAVSWLQDGERLSAWGNGSIPARKTWWPECRTSPIRARMGRGGGPSSDATRDHTDGNDGPSMGGTVRISGGPMIIPVKSDGVLPMRDENRIVLCRLRPKLGS